MENANFLQWRSDYSIGIHRIDQQHKEIMMLISDLLKICRENSSAGHELFNDLVSLILEYFENHFKDEEDLMLEIDYPQYEKHKKRHDALLEDVRKMMEKAKNEKQKPSLINVVIFLREWFIENIYGEDKQMGEYFNNYKEKEETSGLVRQPSLSAVP